MYKINVDLKTKSFEAIENIQQKRIVMRSELNVAVDEEGRVTDSTRLKEALPMIKYFAKNTENLVILAHLGRPEKRERKSSFWSVKELMLNMLSGEDIEVELVEDLNPVNILKIKGNKNSGSNRKIFLLENVRFFPGEQSEDLNEKDSFLKALAELGNVYVNDAFGSYRKSASTYDIAKLLPSYLGMSMLKELEALQKLENPSRPVISILGGAKLSEKLDALKSLLEISDKVVVGGAMAYTILKAKGISIGKSLFEEEKLEDAKKLVSKFDSKLVLPIDHLIADDFDKQSPFEETNAVDIPENKIAIDIGPKSIELFDKEIRSAKTIVWNGPMGVFEWNHAEKGTREVLNAILSTTEAYKLAGGGDSIAAINKFGVSGFDHVSTGGGATLAFLAYEEFPTLDVILKSE